MDRDLLPKPLPAHETKDLDVLEYRLWPSDLQINILQNNSTPNQTGCTLWLGSQILSVYLQNIIKREHVFRKTQRPQAIEVGAGTGLCAMTLAFLGYDTIATDMALVVSSTLNQTLTENQNILGTSVDRLQTNQPLLQARELDWDTEPDLWEWYDSDLKETGQSSFAIDITVACDVVFAMEAIDPLVRTLTGIAKGSIASKEQLDKPCKSKTITYLSLEVRDPDVVARFFNRARDAGFTCDRVPHSTLSKMMDGLGWNEEDWAGVQIWKMRWKNRRP